MKRILLLLLFVIGFVNLFGSKPTIRQILEAELPEIWRSVEEVYIWEGESFVEFKIRESPIRKEVCEALGIPVQKTPMCSFLFDVDGNKTSYFLAHTFAHRDSISVMYKNTKSEIVEEKVKANEMGEYGLYTVTIYKEEMDENGIYQLIDFGDTVNSKRDSPVFYYRNYKKFKDIRQKPHNVLYYKEYKISFNKDRTRVFLHLI